jgi:class 3 adenylate cyclase/ABC-type transport system involved in cytochrome c biogenesis ATPase subunit
MKQGPLAGQRFSVESQLVVGRVGADADLTIDDPLISRRHAVIRLAAGVLEIEDLGSLNGTWVNGERLEAPRGLSAGDVVQFGGVSFEVEGDPVDPAGTVFAPALRTEGAAAPPEAAQPPASEDELRLVTALFADVVGSTKLGELLGSEQTKIVVGECVSRMTHSVERFGGVVQAYMGDGIAAFFGVPRAHENDAERAARAALAIAAEVQDYAEEVRRAWQISDFNVRIGINTGETAVGLVGGASPQSVSMGDTANVAARLQSIAAPGSIVVGEATAKALIRTFALESLGDVTVKGRQAPVTTWRLIGPQAGLRASGARPLVDRETEMSKLQAALAELEVGRGQIVLLLGEAGIGKTRLLVELRSIASGRVTWLEGHTHSYGSEVVYGPLIQMLKDWIGAEEGEAALSVWTKLRAKQSLLPASKHPDVLPHLAHLLSLRLDQAEAERLSAASPSDLAREIRSAYRTWVASLAEQGPTVLAIEDVHWVDAASRELIDELLELTEQEALLVLMTLRIDPASEGWDMRVEALGDHPHRTTELRLTPLDARAARLLLQGLPRSAELDEADLDLIVAGAEGNPLYLEELVNTFADNAGLGQQHTWAPTVTGPKVLTPTLESLLLARIDALPEEGRRLAQLSAVIGRSFLQRILEQVSGTGDVEAELTALVRADVIRELRRYPEPEYIFRHGLLQQASLSTLPPRRRRALHGAVAAAFESVFAACLDDHLEVIAHHYARSDNPVKALDYLDRAGERAAALNATHSARELWGQALKVAQKLGDDSAIARAQARLATLEPTDS